MKKFVNKLNNEVWLCENINDTTNIDGIDFVRVRRVSGNTETKLIAKDCLVEVINNEFQVNGNLLNG